MAYQTIHGRRVRVASPKTVVQVSIHVPVAIGEQPCRGEHERFVLVRFSSGLSTSLCAAWPTVSAQRCSAIYTHAICVMHWSEGGSWLARMNGILFETASRDEGAGSARQLLCLSVCLCVCNASFVHVFDRFSKNIQKLRTRMKTRKCLFHFRRQCSEVL